MFSWFVNVCSLHLFFFYFTKINPFVRKGTFADSGWHTVSTTSALLLIERVNILLNSVVTTRCIVEKTESQVNKRKWCKDKAISKSDTFRCYFYNISSWKWFEWLISWSGGNKISQNFNFFTHVRLNIDFSMLTFSCEFTDQLELMQMSIAKRWHEPQYCLWGIFESTKS